MAENVTFTARLIAEAQKRAPADSFALVAAEYLTKHQRILLDVQRGVFWVRPPTGPMQVATFIDFADRPC